jgi:hypothetical protein
MGELLELCLFHALEIVIVLEMSVLPLADKLAHSVHQHGSYAVD